MFNHLPEDGVDGAARCRERACCLAHRGRMKIRNEPIDPMAEMNSARTLWLWTKDQILIIASQGLRRQRGVVSHPFGAAHDG